MISELQSVTDLSRRVKQMMEKPMGTNMMGKMTELMMQMQMAIREKTSSTLRL